MHFGARRRIPGSGASAVGHLSVGSPCREGKRSQGSARASRCVGDVWDIPLSRSRRSVVHVKELQLSRMFLSVIALVAVTLVIPMVAEAQLSSGGHYDAIASALAGFPVVADGEDDYTEWSSMLPGLDTYAGMGFTAVIAFR